MIKFYRYASTAMYKAEVTYRRSHFDCEFNYSSIKSFNFQFYYSTRKTRVFHQENVIF